MFVLTVAMNCLSTAEQTYETCAPDDARLLPASTEAPNTRAAQASVAADRRFVATGMDHRRVIRRSSITRSRLHRVGSRPSHPPRGTRDPPACGRVLSCRSESSPLQQPAEPV